MRQFHDFEKRLDKALQLQPTPRNEDLLVSQKSLIKPQTPTFFINFAPKKSTKKGKKGKKSKRNESEPSMPVSLLKLILSEANEEKGKSKGKSWKSKKLGSAFKTRRSSRMTSLSRQLTSSKAHGTSRSGTGQSGTGSEQSEERSTVRKQITTINSRNSSIKSPAFEHNQSLSSIHSLEQSKELDKSKRNSVGGAENAQSPRL